MSYNFEIIMLLYIFDTILIFLNVFLTEILKIKMKTKPKEEKTLLCSFIHILFISFDVYTAKNCTRYSEPY